MTASATTRVFMYGILRRGESNHALLANARFVGEAHSAARFTLFALDGHPGMVAGGVTAVVGEIYEVDALTLARLDLLEDHPFWYRRARIELADGAEVETYLLPAEFVEGRASIPGGDWVRFRTSGGS